MLRNAVSSWFKKMGFTERLFLHSIVFTPLSKYLYFKLEDLDEFEARSEML
jgi:hypothetical protein